MTVVEKGTFMSFVALGRDSRIHRRVSGEQSKCNLTLEKVRSTSVVID